MQRNKILLPSMSFIITGSFLLFFFFVTGCNSSGSIETVEKQESKMIYNDSLGIYTLPGFEVELLYEVPKEEQGTWVRLSMNDKGRLVASDQYDKGMYWIDLIEDENGQTEATVEKIELPATGAQGLTWYNGSLYANVNGKGIYKMSESLPGKGLDTMLFLGGPQSPSEHGNHALVPLPEGEGMYVINGNHTPLPDEYTSKVLNWEEDILLTRQWDAQGHAAGIYAPGGYVARIDSTAEKWDILSVGYRNQYDMAIHPNGEMFTFDSDMEWDMGMPWYRPTRILHVVSGSDYGWRSGSGKWKEFYEDSPPPVLNVGPASPTGVFFGTGAKFPADYQKALFAMDWTYGIIYAFHLEPKGASYTARAEEFLSGQPLAVVDGLIGKDGALYFITGGWSNETNLYRVTYKGHKETEPIKYNEKDQGYEARNIRHTLESFHGKEDTIAIRTAWPYLDDPDKYIRNAARVAVEFQPVDEWIDRLRQETRAQAIITGSIALARAGRSDYLTDGLEVLGDLDFHSLSEMERLGYLRALSLCIMRLGDPQGKMKQELSEKLLSYLNDNSEKVNIELVRVLIRLDDEKVIEPALGFAENSTTPEPPDWKDLVVRNNSYGGTVERMLENPPPVNQLEYLFMLRNMKTGWSMDQRRRYFTLINDAGDAMGGQSFWGFLERMRDEASLTLTDEERMELGDIITVPIAKGPPFEVEPVQGPGRKWTMEEALDAINAESGHKDFELGRNAFFATGCASCHRFDGMGGAVGPDLNSVGNRFSTQKILEDIIHPDAVISDMYGSYRVTLKSGRYIEGLVVEDEDFIRIYRRDPDRAPDIISRENVESINSITKSQMPEGLLNPLNADELRSLIAYLKSGGDQESDLFK